jgi:hypothetical protein
MVIMIATAVTGGEDTIMNGDEKRYTGIRGWLLLLCVNLTILDPAAMLLNIFVVTNVAKPQFDVHPELMRLLLINGACSICLAVFSVYAGLSLWKALPSGVRLARRYLVTACLYSLFSLALPSLAGIPAELRGQVAAGNLFNSLVTILYLAGWYLYIRRSRRVRATYGP